MSDPWGPEGGSSAGLVALLDLLERPAAVVGRGGVILGANQRFLDLAVSLVSPVPLSIQPLLAEESLGEFTRLWEESEPARSPLEFRFADGQVRPLRVQFLSTAGGSRIALLVVHHPAGAGQVRPLRGEPGLRHDLAGPITAILGTAELLLIRDVGLPAEVREALGQIIDNCSRMTEILARSRAGATGRREGA